MRRTIAEMLAELRTIDEQPKLEAKRSLSEDAYPSISAFSNEPDLGGGTILFGIWRAEKGAPYEVAGVALPDQLTLDVTNSCSAEKFNRRIRPYIWTEVVEGKLVVAVEVPEARPGEKPIYLSKVGLPKGAFRRIGSSDVKCSDDDVRDLHQRAAERPYEDTLVADATMHDLDLDVLSSYRKALIDANPATDVRDLELSELVQALGGARLEAGTLRPTVAGVLLFGRQLALRRLFPFFRVDYIRIQGTEWVENTERRFETLDVRQPLLVAFRRIYQAILDELPRSVELRAGSPERVESPTVPERVIREALVNALCHRDYRVQSPIQVIRYTNRIEFRNAGHSLVDEEALGEPGSESRNPRIADVFREMRLAENKGSGVRVMRREMENAKLALPLFDSDRENNRFIATLLFTHLLGDEQRAWLTSLNTVALSREEELALVYCREEAPIRNASLRDLTGLDTLAASAVLRGLRDKGLLVAVGAGAQTHYILSTAAAAASQTTLSPEPPAAPMEPGVRGQGVLFPDLPPTPLRSQAGPDAGGLGADAGGLGADAGGLGAGAGGLGLPPDLVRRVAGLSPKARGPILRQLIRELCAVRPLSAGQLATLLNRRKPRHLAEEHLAPMVLEGVLVRTIPENPTDPRQAFRTILPKNEE